MFNVLTSSLTSLTQSLTFSPPKEFTISLDGNRTTFFPGETIRGTLRIVNDVPIKCRGIRVQFTGTGFSHIIRGSGDDRKDYYNNHCYANCRHTLWGDLFKTPVLDNAGANALYGPPWAPDEGVFHIPLNESDRYLILRVMDYDWGKKDDLLGEASIMVLETIDNGVFTVPLFRNGKQEGGASLTLSVSTNRDVAFEELTKARDPTSTNRVIRVQIVSANGLRSADMFGKNDVYVQAYTVPPGKQVVSGSALPPPEELIELPAGSRTIPFQFQLPTDLPSSFIAQRARITYSVYANIDVAWNLDPSRRVFVNIMQPSPSALMMSPRVQTLANREILPQCCIPPCCCWSFDLTCFSASGNFSVTLRTSRSAYAPGEKMDVTLQLETDSPETAARIQTARVTLQQTFRRAAQGHEDNICHNVSSIECPSLQPGTNIIEFPVPSVPPTYTGGLGFDTDWFSRVSSYGARWGTRPVDPVTWGYHLSFELKLNVPGLTLDGSRTYYLRMPINISGLGLYYLPPIPSLPVALPIAFLEDGGFQNPSEAKSNLTPPNWRNYSQVAAVLPQVSQSFQAQPAFAVNAEMVYNPGEDHNADKNALYYTPQYIMSPPVPPPVPSAPPLPESLSR